MRPVHSSCAMLAGAPLAAADRAPRPAVPRSAAPRIAALATLVVLASSSFASAQRGLNEKDIPVADPELERKALRVQEGFEINLYAADPRIAKPIQMNFDPQGRLWIASSTVYPHVLPGQKADDKILVIEDRDGDGVAETTTVFADGLLIPTAVAPGDGGVYVGASTELLHFADTDGDGKADRRRVVLSGFGTEDTHHMIHTLRWGSEGFLYFNQSIYIHSHIETPHGVRRLGGGGIWKFRPDTLELEVFARGMVNGWGHQLNDVGVSFATDGAGGQGINYIVPGASYETAVGAPRILPGLNPGSPKYCGLEIVGGGHFPDDWQGSLVTNDFRGHRVCRFVVSKEGSGFVSRQQPSVIETDHVAFRPIDVQMGPDGALYIADWYNPIIQHGEVDFRDPRRDHTHGRIWRLTCKGRPTVPRPKLVGVPTPALLDAFKSGEPWTRRQAHRVLAERGRQEASALGEWVSRLDPADPNIERHRLEGLWAFESLDVPRPELLRGALQARDAGVRAAAVRVLRHWRKRVDGALQLLASAVADPDARVRLEAVRALGALEDRQSVASALDALDHPVDRFLDYAIWLTARELEPFWLPDARAGSFGYSGAVRHLIFALEAVGGPPAVQPLVALFSRHKVPVDAAVGVLDVVAAYGAPDDLRTVFDSAIDAKTGPAERLALLTALADTSTRRGIRPKGALGDLSRYLDAGDEPLQIAVVRCIGLWKVESLRDGVARIAGAKPTGGALRLAAMEALAALGGPDSRAALERLAIAREVPQANVGAVIAMTALDVRRAAALAASRLAEETDSAIAVEILDAFLRRSDGAKALAAALDGKKLPVDIAKIALRTVSGSGRPVPELAEVLTRAAGKPALPTTGLSAAELQRLVEAVRARGDAKRGEAVFRRSDLSCLKCHAIGGAGGRVGPDLISIGSSAQVDYLIDSILVPNKSIKENYHTLVIRTVAGRIFTGIKIRQTDREIILRDAEDRDVSVPLESIEEQTPGTSMMPAGLTEKLTENELIDLVRFLSELGKPGPYAIKPEPVARRWRVLAATDDAKFRIQRTSIDAVNADDPAFQWEPAYSTVAGDLPLDAIPELRVRYGTIQPPRGVGYARCEFELREPAPCRFRVNSPTGLKAWLDGAPLPLESDATVRCAPGMHRLTFQVDLNARREALRVGIAAGEGSTASVQFAGGK